MKICQRKKSAVIKDSAYFYISYSKMETRSYSTLQKTETVQHKAKFLLDPKSVHKFNPGQKDGYTNWLQTMKSFKCDRDDMPSMVTVLALSPV